MTFHECHTVLIFILALAVNHVRPLICEGTWIPVVAVSTSSNYNNFPSSQNSCLDKEYINGVRGPGKD